MSATSPAPPSWFKTFYSYFPLLTLPQEDPLPVDHQSALWIVPPTSSRHTWASSDPECLRLQLLFLFRDEKISFRPWIDPKTAPNGNLPVLQHRDRLLATEKIRPWLDARHPQNDLQGLPSESAYTKAIALAQLVTRLHVSSPTALPKPPVLSAGLTTPLPASLTGDSRIIDTEAIESRNQETWDALDVLVGDGWIFGAEQPTPLDALIAAYAFNSDHGRGALEEYVERVMDYAARRL